MTCDGTKCQETRDLLDAALVQLAKLRQTVAEHAHRLAQEPDGAPYQIAKVRRWWQLTGKEREAALAPLRHWVGSVYVPGYGLLADQLAPCWEAHDAVLYQLDWLAELFGVLYLRDSRDRDVLVAEAEYQARLLPQAASLMTDELRKCSRAGCRLTARKAVA